MKTPAFCIYIDTICQGPTPTWHDEKGNPVVYQTRVEAEREIAELTIERLEQFLKGEREFEDAMNVEDYIVEVDVLADGSILDEAGNHFGSGNWIGMNPDRN